MAFVNSQKLYPCRKCGDKFKYFKMMESWRDATKGANDELTGEVWYWRLCAGCELSLLKEE